MECYTLAAWFKSTSGNQLADIVTVMTQPWIYGVGPGLELQTDGRMRVLGWPNLYGTPTTLGDGQWHHAAVTWSYPDVVLYVDGSAVGTKTGPESWSVGDPTYPMIGKHRDVMGRFWVGMIDDVRVYDRALSATEIGELAGQ
ncbi:MAG: LamG domain-containing protein [Pirellulales bacterium]|nr:LamG domain-containing protein [Pirellulales bacterium]